MYHKQLFLFSWQVLKYYHFFYYQSLLWVFILYSFLSKTFFFSIDFLKKNGLLQKWMQQHLLSADVCAFRSDNKLSQNEQALTIQEFYTAFCILCIGIIVSIIIFSIEAWRAFKNQSKFLGNKKTKTIN